MLQHAIPLVRLDPNVFQKQNAGLFHTQRPGCTQPGFHQGQTAAQQLAGCAARPQDAQSIRAAERIRLTLHGGIPGGGLFPALVRPVRGHHGAVKRHQPALLQQPGLQRGMVGVANKRLGMGADQPRIEQRQQFRRSPPTACAQDGFNRCVRKRRVEIGSALLGGARVIQRSAAQGVRHHHGLVAVGAQPLHPARDQLRPRSRRR